MSSGEFREDLEIALSGGGFRAAAFGLGALLYLVDSRLNRRTVTIASVSGGSITNGFVASECDFGQVDAETFHRVAADLAQRISGKGRFHGFWLISRPYLVFLAVTGLIILAWFTDIFVALVAQTLWGNELRAVTGTEMISLAVIGVVWGVAALNRGALVLSWLSRTFFRDKRITMASLSDRSTDHVYCATDLTSSSPFFFSTKGGGRVFSESYGRGEGRDIPVQVAVAASAAFPPAIPPLRFRLRGRQFPAERPHPRFIYLSDGGVWNNLGTDWSRLRNSLLTAEIQWIKREQGQVEETGALLQALGDCPMGGVLAIVNASKPERRRGLWMVKVPVLSFVTTVVRVLDVAVNSTVRARSSDIERVARVRMLNDPDRWELGKEAPRPHHTVWGEGRGTDQPLAIAVEMVRKPGETAAAYKMVGGLAQWLKRPDEYQRDLEDALQELGSLLGDGDSILPTTLDNLGPRATLRMIVLGYLNTRETFTTAFADHSPPPIPKREFFEGLVEQPGTTPWERT